MELTITSIIAAFAFITGIVSANIMPITISGNVSVYPGEDVSFVCSLVEPDVLNVVFQWTRQNGLTNTSMMLAEDFDEEGSTGASGGGDIVHNSTLSILNVNYTDNDEGYYCNSPNCSVANCTQSSISYLTVLSPVIVSITSSPVLLQFGNMTTLNCTAMGGPRLELTLQRNGVDVAMGIIGDQMVAHTIVLAGNDDIGDYTCRATIDSMQDEETVTVIVAPYNVMITDSDGATIVTNSTTVNNGDSLVLNCIADGGPANMYRWFKDNMLFDNDSVVNITSVEATDGGLYECRVSNDAGNSTANVTINVAPRFVVMPQDTEVIVGTQVMLSCSADGFPVPTISWLYNDMIMNDGITSDMNTTVTSSTLSLSSVQLNNTGDYVCQITSTVVTMSLNSTATVNGVVDNVVGLMNMSAFPGEDVNWMCSVQSTTDLTFTWYINGAMVSSEMGTASDQTITNSYTLTNINYTDSNSVVMCRAAGDSVTVESDNVTLTVLTPVIAPIMPSSPVLLQSGDSVNLTCSAMGGPRLVLAWQRDGMDIVTGMMGDSMVTRIITSASNNDLGNYTCLVIIDSEQMESTVLVVVAPHNVMITDSSAVAVTNPTTMNNGDSLVLDCTAAGGPANMYRWFKDDMLFDNDSVVNITSVEATDGGLYECRVSNDAGNSTASVTINVAPRFVVMPQDTEVLVGTQVMLSCSADGFPVPTISWLYNDMIISDGITSDMNTTVSSSTLSLSSVQLNNTGDYVCQITSTVVTMSLNSTATVNGVVDNVDGLMNMSAFPGENVTWMCSVQSTTDLTFTWYINGAMVSSEMGTASGQTISSSYTLTNINYTDSNSVVMCRAGGNSVTVESDNVTLTVLQPNITDIMFTPPLTGSSLLLNFTNNQSMTCTASGGPRIITMWQFNNGSLSTVATGSNSVTYTISFSSTSDTGTYYCVATIDGMTDTSDMYTLFVAPYQATIMGNTLRSNGTQLELTCSSEGGPDLVYSWSRTNTFSATTTTNSTLLNISDLATVDGGSYTCTVTNDAGSTSTSVIVYVAPYDVVIMGDNTYDNGNQLELVCSSEGEPSLVYSWSRVNDFSNGTITNTNSLTVSDLATVDGGDYTCNVTNDAGTTSTTVTVYVAPYNVVIMGDNTYDNGIQFMLNCLSEGGPDLLYSWSRTNTFSNDTVTNTNTLTISDLATVDGGDYTCTVTNDAGSNSTTVTVYVAPYNVVIMGDNTYDNGDQLELNCSSEGGPDLEYSWNRTNTFSNDTVTNTNTLTITGVATVDGGDYTCTVTNDAGTSSHTITVNVAPYNVVIMGDNTYDNGDQLELNCSSEGGPDLVYSWSRTNTFSATTTTNTSTLTISDLATVDGGDYTCTVNNSAGSSSTTVTVYIAPYNVVIMGNNTYDNGVQLELNCSSEGGPDLEYSWSRTNIFSATTTTNTSTLTISDLATVDGGEYTCTVTNDAETETMTVTVYVAPYNVVIMGDNTYDNGDQLELNCSSEGGPDLEYSWSRTNEFLATTTTNTSTLNISDLATVDGGDYTCTVTNDAGASMNTITVYVAPYNVVIMGDNTYDNGSQLELNCSSEGGPDLEYSWSRTNTFSATTTTNTSTLTISDLATVDGGEYTCTVSNDAGASMNTITVYVVPYNVVIMGDNTYDNGDQLELNCSSEGGPDLVYSWSRTNTFSATTTTNTSTLTISDLATVDGGDYTCTVTNDAGTSNRTITVYVGPVFTTDPVAQEVVIENSFTLDCIAEGFPRPSIQWYLNNAIITDSSNRVIVDTTSMNSITSTLTVMMAEFNDSGVYYCEAVSSQSGLATVNSDMVNITVVERPVISPPLHNVTLGESIMFNCTEFGSPPFAYQWFMIDTPTGIVTLLQNETSNSYSIISVLYNHTGQYICEASNSLGVFSNSTPAQLIVRPSMVEHPVAMQAVYPGVSVSFSCRAEGFSMLSYSWFVVASGSDIGMEIENETNPMYTISDPRYDQDDTGYYCIATNNEGIAVSNTASLSVLQPNITDIMFTPPLTGSSLLLNFTNNQSMTCTASGGPRIMTMWQFDDGSLSTVATGSNSVTYTISSSSTSNTGTYHCVATIDGMTDTSDMYTLFVAPYNVVIMGDNTYDNGDQLELNCSSEGGPDLEYSWSRTNEFSAATDTNTSTLTISDIATVDGGEYTCTVTNAAGTSMNTITVYVTPHNVVIMGNNTYDNGDQLELNCSSEGGPDLEYSWSRTNTFSATTTTNTSTLTISDLATVDGGDYTCTVSNDAGSNSTTVTVYVAPYNVVITGDNTYDNGDQSELNCSSEGGPDLEYSWSRTNTFSATTTTNTSTLTISDLATVDGGDYTCTVSNDAGTSMNTITVYVAPYDVVIMGDNTYDNGDQLELNCSSEGGPDLVYSWSRINDFSNDTVTNTNTLTISDLATVDGGDYTCTVTNDAGSSNATVTVYIAPYNVVIMGDNTYDNGDQLELNCSSEGGPDLEYSWSRTNTFSATTTTNTSTLTISDLATVDGGEYTCTVTNDAGTDTMTVTVYVAPYNVVIMGDNTYDNGDQLELNCTSEGGPDLEYSWSRTNTFSATTTTNTSTLTISDLATVDGGNYTCTVSNDAGTSMNTITVYVAPYNATITEVVVINMVTYTCYAEGGPGNTYEWLRLRDNSVVSSIQELILDNTDPLDGGDYQCTITNNAGDITVNATLNVAAVIVDSPQTQNVTAGQSFMLTCNATGYPVPTIEWRQNGTSYTIRDPTVITITPTDELRSSSSIITVTNATTSDTGLYQCVATNVVVTDIQNATVIVQNCPDEPINVGLFNVASRDLFINWTEPHDNNAPVTGYNITYQNPDCLVMAPNNQSQDVTVTSMVEQAMIPDLHPGESYSFIVIAINDICPSLPSIPVSVRTMEEAPRVAPIVATPVPTTTTINVTWNELACQDHHGVITHYEVRYNTSDFNEDRSPTLNTTMGDDTSLLIEDLEEFGNYTIEVRAHTAAGAGPYSSPINVQTLPDIPSGAVTGLDARNINATIVELSWRPVMARQQNGIISSYNIYYRQNDSMSSDYFMITNITEMERDVTGLNESQLYIFEVTAINQVGESDVNATIMIMTNESTPATTVQNIRIVNDTNDTVINVVFTWDPPSDPNGFIRYYRVEFQEISDGSGGGRRKRVTPLGTEPMNAFANFTGPGEAPTNITLDDLVAYRTYSYSVFAATSVGEGPPLNGNFITREDTPLAPNNLTVNYPGMPRNSTTLVVTWDRPSCDRGVLSGYELCYVPNSMGDCVSNGMRVNITGPDTLWYTINDLSINTNYTVEVRGRTGAGLGDPDTAINSTDEDAPTPVANLQAVFTAGNNTRGTYTITWESPPTPSDGSSNGSYYQQLDYSFTSAYTVGPQYNGTFNNISIEQGVDQHVIPDAFYFSDYTFTITTINIKYSIDNGPVEIQNQSSPAAPTAVRDLTAVPSSPNSIYLTWKHPEYPNSELTRYIVYYNDNPDMIQMFPNILSDGFNNMSVPSPVTTTSYNLTGLDVFTNYSIHMSVMGDSVLNAPIEQEILQRTNTSAVDSTGTIVDLMPLDPATVKPSTGGINVRLPELNQIEVGTLYLYGVVVVLIRGNSVDNNNLPKDIINSRNGNLPPPYARMADVYTAAVWSRSNVQTNFTLGDGSTTIGPDGTTYVNQRLMSGRLYGVFYYIRLNSDTGSVGEGPLLLGSNFTSVQRTTSSGGGGGGGAGGIAAGVVVALLVVIIIVVVVIFVAWYYRRRHDKRAIYTGEVAFTESENVVLNPVAPQPYLGTFQPIPVSDFRDHVAHMHADSDYRFSEEYGSVEPDHSPTTEATLHASNTNKNRYANISAYDHSRVRLQVVPNEPGSDYINANYIDGYKKKNAYIATQGPLPDTFASFWRMIWELDIQTIVMLTNLEEKGRVKCHQYWPDDKVTIPGSVKVSIQEQLELADYAVRTFSLKRSGSKEERIVKQFHYTTWPDFGVPEHPTPVLRFTRRILSSDQQEAGPIVVHCSAGVGRSGTFITLHSQLQRIASEATIDIFPFVRQMRYRRCHMVQTEPQYVFIHDALLEAVECGDTEVVARDLKIQYRKLSSASEGNPTKRLIEDEFKKIDDSIHLKTDHVAGQAPANKAKNRYANILPFDGSRCRISAIPGQEGSDYINASYVDGYLKQKAYVATQGPLPDTAAEFWRMVWELKSATIVMLVKEREQGRVKCHHYWPDTGAETFNQYQVVAHATNDYQEYTLREFKLVDKKDNSSLPVRHFQFSTWPEGGNVPENSAGLIDLIGQIQKWQQHSGNKPIIVHCSGGSGRTGTYIAISMLLDRLKVEGVVDVFQTVRALRLQRMHMVQSLVQYEFCYKTVLEFLDSFELYSNFK